jgi:PPOX class probable F420-dependent enzyme
MPSNPMLTSTQRTMLATARRAVLATIGADGRPRLVPICFALDPALPTLWSPIDEKPKTVGAPRGLARVRDIERDPRVTVLVDHWDEDWSRLAWIRCDGLAEVMGSPPGDVVAALRDKYPQYLTHDLEARPVIRIVLERTSSWAATGTGDGPAG